MELKLQTGYRQIFGMALPIALAMVVPQINFVTNNIFLGGLGEVELASAGITGVYYLIFAVMGIGLNNGVQALIARRAGQNLPKEIGRLFYHGVWVAIAFSAIGIFVTYTIAPLILRNSLQNPTIANQVIDFLYIRIWGLPFLYLYVMRNALLVGINQTKFLVWGTLSEAAINIIFDYGLIYGHFGLPELGFNGAAYASILAEATGLFVIYIIIHAKGMHRTFAFFEQIKWDASVFKLILVQSAPLVAQYTISIVCWEFFYILIEHQGSRALAISNTMRNIIGMFGVFAWAFGSTANTMVSNIIGQGRTEEVMALIKRISFVSLGVSSLVFLLLNSIPEKFLSFYGQSDEFILEAIPVVRIVSLALLLMSFATVWLNAVTGSGNSVVNLFIELFALVVYCTYVYVVLEMYQMSIVWGWGSECVYWIIMFCCSYAYMLSGRWRGKKI
jgi:putative MATE family efflux protein